MLRWQSGSAFDITLVEQRSGFVSILFKGKDAQKIFKNEAGGHRWQRISPTEKRGRVHTSTVTVAILSPETPDNIRLDEKDIEIQTKRGSGPGGQHRNKTDSCVVAIHKPTKISVQIDSKSQHQSKALALRILAERVSEDESRKYQEHRGSVRKNQVGSGQRGDKIRTYRSQDDRVTDHRTGQTWKLSHWIKGNW